MLRRLYVLVPIVFVMACILSSGGSRLSARAEPQPKVPEALLKKQAEVARSVYTQKMELLKSGEAHLDERLFFWSERWMEAELALSEKPADRNALMKAHIKRVKDLESLAAAQAKAGHLRDVDLQVARYYAIEAEITLLEAKED